MEKLENVDLSALVEDSSKELMDEKRKQAAGLIKVQLQRIEQLSLDVRNAERTLKKKQEALVKAQQKIDKIKAGDWSLLAEQKDNSKENNE